VVDFGQQVNVRRQFWSQVGVKRASRANPRVLLNASPLSGTCLIMRRIEEGLALLSESWASLLVGGGDVLSIKETKSWTVAPSAGLLPLRVSLLLSIVVQLTAGKPVARRIH